MSGRGRQDPGRLPPAGGRQLGAALRAPLPPNPLDMGVPHGAAPPHLGTQLRAGRDAGGRMAELMFADYGDAAQRQRNAADAERRLAAAERVGLPGKGDGPPPMEVAYAALRKPYRPPFWDSKAYGTPVGQFVGRKLAQNPYDAGFEDNLGGRGAVGADVPVVLGPGNVLPRGQAAAARGPAARAVSARAAAAGAGVGGRAPAVHADALAVGPPRPERPASAGALHAIADPAMAKRVLVLEDSMRAALHAKKQLHFVEAAVLLKAFRLVDRERRRRVDARGFVEVWAALGVGLTLAEAGAFFGRYGQDRQGLLPYEVFTKALLLGRARLAGMAAEGVLRRAFDKPDEAAGFHGKIVYPQCRSAVFPPTHFDPAAVVRSACAPDAQLDLEFVYGYNGLSNYANNLYFSYRGEVLYFAAAVCVAYNREAHTQRFFTAHDDDVTCLAVSSDRVLAASGQVGLTPAVHVWKTDDLSLQATLAHERGARGIVAVTFSSDSKLIIAAATDNNHTLYMWDWARRRLLASMPSFNGTPPQVYGLQCHSRSAAGEFVSYGVNHFKWWSLAPAGLTVAQWMADPRAGSWTQQLGSFALAGSPHPVTSVVLLPPGPPAAPGKPPAKETWVTGAPDGRLMVWQDRRIVRAVRAHAPGVKAPRQELVGGKDFDGVRTLLMLNDGRTLVSGGADGHLLFWSVGNGDLDAASLTNKLAIASPYQDDLNRGPPSFRGLDVQPGGAANVLVAGTNACDIWEIGERPRVLIQGHTDDLYGVAWNPRVPTQFATACDSDRINVWDAAARRMVLSANIAFPARCCAYSPSGDHLAVGLVNGGLKILNAQTLQPLFWAKNSDEETACVAYSPDGLYLALGSHDSFLDLYAVHKGYTRLRRCAGHAGNVLHVDWSADSRTIASTSSSYEILCFEVATGKQSKQDQRDTVWATQNCVLGFPVMGIWPKDSDGTDVNACDRSHGTGRHLVTADDFGTVKLFNYPVVVKHAPAAASRGHSSHVMNVRFSRDDAFVVSVGGKDRAVFQWRTHGVRPPARAGGDPPVPWCRMGFDCPCCAKLARPGPTPWAPLGESGVHWGPAGAAALEGPMAAVALRQPPAPGRR